MNDVLDELKALFETNLTGRSIKKFYKGEIALVPQSYTPVFMIWGVSTEIIAKSTACDQFVYTIQIRIEDSLNHTLKSTGIADDDLEDQETLINTMEERETNGQLKSNTVMGILRTVSNISGTSYLFNNELTATYSRILKGEYWAVRAELTLTATTDLVERIT